MFRKKSFIYILLVLLILSTGACQVAPGQSSTATAPSQPATTPEALTVMTHDSFAVSESVIQQFDEQNNAKVIFLKSGDTGAALNRAILSKNNPLADVFYGVDNTFLSRALDAGIYEAYHSPLLDVIPGQFKLDPEDRALPVDYGDVCINYDKAYFSNHNLPVPQSLDDLAKPEYQGLLVVENPATSSPGLVFLLTTIAYYGTNGYLDYWRSLRDNGVVIVSGWETAYYTNFSGSSGHGPQPMVVSYASSPAAEVIFAETPIQEAPTASITAPNTCFRQIEFVGILKGTEHLPLAQKFVDFMLSVPFQQDMPEQMFVFPVNPNAKLPQVFIDNVQIPDQPATLSPQDIAQNRDAWINAWTEEMLR
jgi:thiamine transport system substrate-binding protein